MPKEKVEKPEKDEDQLQRFKDKARELECDESDAALEKVLDKLDLNSAVKTNSDS